MYKNSIAEIHFNHTKNAINNLESALASIEHYKQQISLSLAILRDFKVGDSVTDVLSAKDSEFLYHANSIGNDFTEDEEDNGNITLSILDPLEDLVNEYNKAESN